MDTKNNHNHDSHSIGVRLATLQDNLKEYAADNPNQSISYAAGMLEAAIILQELSYDVMERVCEEIQYAVSDFIAFGISRDYLWSLHDSAMDILVDLPLNITIIHEDDDDNDPDPVIVIVEPPFDPAPAMAHSHEHRTTDRCSHKRD